MAERRSGAPDPASAGDAPALGYGTTAKSLHWLIVAIVTTQFVVSWLMPEIGRNAVPSPLIDLHFSLGVLILVVMAVRLLHRLREPVAGLAAKDLPAWERRSAQALHRLFYLLLIAGPFLGWASASAHKLPVNVFGLFRLPDIAAPRARWALMAGDVHKFAMWTLLALIGLHVAAAFYHGFVRHDRVLARMLFGTRP
jgi:cytochrome b561